jgi:hypothetical protein
MLQAMPSTPVGDAGANTLDAPSTERAPRRRWTGGEAMGLAMNAIQTWAAASTTVANCTEVSPCVTRCPSGVDAMIDSSARLLTTPMVVPPESATRYAVTPPGSRVA